MLVLLVIMAALVWVKISQKEVEIKPVEKKVARIAVVADIHNDVDYLKKAINRSKELGVELMIVDGDMSKEGKKEELLTIKKVLDESGLKYLTVPGNHDWWDGKYSEVFGKSYQSLKWGDFGYKLILVDNGNWWGLGESQKEWLGGEIGECKVIKCVVFGHVPLNHPNSKHVMGEDRPKVMTQGLELIKQMIENKVERWVSGHIHFQKEYEKDGLKTIIVGSLSQERSAQRPRWTVLGLGETLGVAVEVVQ